MDEMITPMAAAFIASIPSFRRNGVRVKSGRGYKGKDVVPKRAPFFVSFTGQEDEACNDERDTRPHRRARPLTQEEHTGERGPDGRARHNRICPAHAHDLVGKVSQIAGRSLSDQSHGKKEKQRPVKITLEGVCGRHESKGDDRHPKIHIDRHRQGGSAIHQPPDQYLIAGEEKGAQDGPGLRGNRGKHLSHISARKIGERGGSGFGTSIIRTKSRHHDKMKFEKFDYGTSRATPIERSQLFGHNGAWYPILLEAKSLIHVVKSK